MSSVNKAILIGRLGRDPESRTFPNGGRVVSFSLATDETWRDKATGERKQRTEWHNIAVFNEPLGKIVEQYCKKGSQIYLEGAIKTREYTDKDGNKRKATEIVLAQFQGAVSLLDTRSGGDDRHAGGPDAYGTTTSRPAAGDSAGSGRSPDLDDDIPF